MRFSADTAERPPGCTDDVHFTEALAEDYRDRLDGEALEYVRQIRESAQGMERLINALLDLSRVTRADLIVVSISSKPKATAVAASAASCRAIRWAIS